MFRNRMAFERRGFALAWNESHPGRRAEDRAIPLESGALLSESIRSIPHMNTSIDRVCLGGLGRRPADRVRSLGTVPGRRRLRGQRRLRQRGRHHERHLHEPHRERPSRTWGARTPTSTRLTVPAGEILQVDCLHGYLNGDIDTYLYDAASPTCGDQASYLIRGWTSSDDETWTWPNTTGAAATYIVEIDPWDSDTDFDWQRLHPRRLDLPRSLRQPDRRRPRGERLLRRRRRPGLGRAHRGFVRLGPGRGTTTWSASRAG